MNHIYIYHQYMPLLKRTSSCLPVRQQAPLRRHALSSGVLHTFTDPGGIFICHRSCKQPQPLLPLFAGREQAKIGICCRLQIQAEVEKPNLMLAGGVQVVYCVHRGQKDEKKTKQGKLLTTALIPTGASSSHC